MDIKQNYVLITNKECQKEVEIATRFARVGFENLLGYLDGGIATWIKAGKPLEKIEYIEVKDLSAKMKAMPIIDVRKQPEFNKVHIDNAILAPLGVNFINEEFKKIPKD